MKIKSPTILSTKVLSEANQNLLVASGIESKEANFIQINLIPIPDVLFEKNIICTSQSALKSVVSQMGLESLRYKEFYCVGNKTKQKIENLDLKVVEVCENSEDLANIIIEKYKNQKFTFLSGTIRMASLPNILSENTIDFKEYHVYETQLTPITIKDKLDAILFYSPSGVKSFLIKNKIEKEMCFCIGKTTAKALNGITNNIKIASEPTVEKTVEACITYFA
jgi:uroporphyrinogen-III synthase